MAGCIGKYDWMAQNILLDGGTIYKIASNSAEWLRRGTAFICNNNPNGLGLSIVKVMLMAISTSSNNVSITYIGSDISELFTFGYIQNERQIDIYMKVNLNNGTNIGIHALGFSVIEKTSLTELTNIITPTKIL